MVSISEDGVSHYKAHCQTTLTFSRHSQLLSSALPSAYKLWWAILQTLWTRSDCCLRSSLIRVHTVCFYDESIPECILIYAADVKSRRLFQVKNIGRIRVNIYFLELLVILFTCAIKALLIFSKIF